MTDDGLDISARDATGTGGTTSADETRCTVGIRPEKLSISRKSATLPNNLRETTERLAYYGNLSHATTRLPRRRIIEVTVVNSGHKPLWESAY